MKRTEIAPKKVLFLHGWSSFGGSKPTFLRFLGYDVSVPALSDWSFWRAVSQAQIAYDDWQPDAIVGSSRGAAVGMNLDSAETPMILLAPAWKRWGWARSVKKDCVVIHSPFDKYVPFSDSVDLCEASGVLIAAGTDHRLNCWEAKRALTQALIALVDACPSSPLH